MTEAKCPRCARVLPDKRVPCACGFSFLSDVAPMPFAGFWIRFLADIYDGCIALGFALPIYFFFDRLVLGKTDFLRAHTWNEFGLSHVVLWGAFLYNTTWLVSRTGQSYGRKLAGITVTDAKTGGRIGFLRTLARNIFAGIISTIFYIGFLWLLVDRRKQTWHDKLFGTVVRYSL